MYMLFPRARAAQFSLQLISSHSIIRCVSNRFQFQWAKVTPFITSAGDSTEKMKIEHRHMYETYVGRLAFSQNQRDPSQRDVYMQHTRRRLMRTFAWHEPVFRQNNPNVSWEHRCNRASSITFRRALLPGSIDQQLFNHVFILCRYTMYARFLFISISMANVHNQTSRHHLHYRLANPAAASALRVYKPRGTVRVFVRGMT